MIFILIYGIHNLIAFTKFYIQIKYSELKSAQSHICFLE